MLKPVIATAAVVVIAGSSIVYAQHRFGDHGFGRSWGPRAEQRQRPSAEDMAAFTDARIAALKAGLELTPDQEKNWPAFEQAVRDAAQMRYLLADQDMTAMLHASRPEILGATLAIGADGTFTETVAFTDEAMARQGETIRMPEQVQRTLENAVAEVEYLNLRDPWFATHS